MKKIVLTVSLVLATCVAQPATAKAIDRMTSDEIMACTLSREATNTNVSRSDFLLAWLVLANYSYDRASIFLDNCKQMELEYIREVESFFRRYKL